MYKVIKIENKNQQAFESELIMLLEKGLVLIGKGTSEQSYTGVVDSRNFKLFSLALFAPDISRPVYTAYVTIEIVDAVTLND